MISQKVYLDDVKDDMGLNVGHDAWCIMWGRGYAENSSTRSVF
jgi:hypothetical protein